MPDQGKSVKGFSGEVVANAHDKSLGGDGRSVTKAISMVQTVPSDEDRRSRLIALFWESSSSAAPLALLT